MTRTAVIGVGSMGKNHARVYTEIPGSEFVGVADENHEVAQAVASRFGVKAYSDFTEMLEKEKPEAITIAVPTAMHEEVALQALEAGVNILIEKPIAATLDEAERIIAKARDTKSVLMVGHIVRFNSAIQALKEKLEKGELGRIYQIFCRRAGPFPQRIRDVGVVIDLAPHDVDIMRFLTDSDPVRLYAETEQRIHTEHEDLLFGTLYFEGGVTGALEINWLTPTKIREVLVLGERGLFKVDDLTQDLYFYENSQASSELWHGLKMLKGVSEGGMVRYPINRYEPLKAELESFLQAVRGEIQVPVSGEDGLAALKISMALVESGIKNEVMKF